MSKPVAAARLTAAAIVTPPLMALQWAFLRVAPAAAIRFPNFYHRNLCRVLGAGLRIEGTPPADGACLLACNHVSWLDIPVLSAAAPLSFIAKSEVAGWPVFGSLARLQRSLFVERERRAATGRFRDMMRARLRAGDILVLFPEGTSSDGNRVLPFKSALMGAAEMTLADGRHVPVYPVTIAYTGRHGLPMSRRERPWFAWYGDMELAPHIWTAIQRAPFEVVVRFHEPLTIDDAGNRKALAEHCENAVREGLVACNAALSRRPCAPQT